MKKSLLIVPILALSLALPAARAQQSQTKAAVAPTSTAQSPMQKTVEAYLRNLYAFGADTIVKISRSKRHRN